MAKVYVFRNLETELNRQQSEICDEAISSILDDVFKGNTSTIFNYCDWPIFSTNVGDQCDKQHMLGRILNELFSRVYAMEVTLELNISINHITYNLECSPLPVEGNNSAREHYISSPIAAYLYMRKIFSQLLFKNVQKNCSHVRFTISVRQTNLEQSLNLNGKLQFIHLMKVQHENYTKLKQPMSSLMKMISALAKNPKTHLRYHNIRLEALLKELLGSKKSTVLINYTILLQQHNVSLIGRAKMWKALYKRKFHIYKCLNQKLMTLQFLGSDGQKLELNDLVEILKKNDSSCQLKLEVRKRLSGEIEQTNQSELAKRPTVVAAAAFDEMQQIKLDAKVNVENILELQDVVAKLATDMQQKVQQLEEKNRVIERLQAALAKANQRMQGQRLVFQRNLEFYSEMFRRLWHQQSNTIKLQEQLRDEQLSKMFETICREFHESQLPQLAAIDVQLAGSNGLS